MGFPISRAWASPSNAPFHELAHLLSMPIRFRAKFSVEIAREARSELGPGRQRA